ncbi:MAG: hypothetical protein M1839_000503 [Geoglossum umbratile]|nr:MAG: hypothetical protein M1839_000503 [Geoglossum umbratile]
MARRQLAALAALGATSSRPACMRGRLFHSSAGCALAALRKSPSILKTQRGVKPSSLPPGVAALTESIGHKAKEFLAACIALRPLKINQVVKLSKRTSLQCYPTLRKHHAQTCTEHDISPREITDLANTVGPLVPSLQNAIIIPLLLTASSLSDPQATITLVSRVLRAPQTEGLTHPSMEFPIRHLSALSSEGNPAAMVLLGRVFESEGKETQALHLFQKATDTEWGGDHGFESGEAGAWLSLGRLKLKSGDPTGGEAALKKGADLNDPYAAFYYALTQPHEGKEYHTYIMKAAVFGVVEAQHNLGVFYLQQQSSVKTGTMFQRMAKEWFILAATGRFGPSQLNLALMLKAEGKDSEGLEWVDRAQRNQAFADEATKVKEKWKDGTVHIGDSSKITIT